MPGRALLWTSPTGRSYLDQPREFTLPHEWTTTDDPRQTIGPADAEHTAAAAPGTRDHDSWADTRQPCPTGCDPTPTAVAVARQLTRQRDNERRQHALARLATLARRREQPGSSADPGRSDDPSSEPPRPARGERNDPRDDSRDDAGGDARGDDDGPPF